MHVVLIKQKQISLMSMTGSTDHWNNFAVGVKATYVSSVEMFCRMNIEMSVTGRSYIVQVN